MPIGDNESNGLPDANDRTSVTATDPDAEFNAAPPSANEIETAKRLVGKLEGADLPTIQGRIAAAKRQVDAMPLTLSERRRLHRLIERVAKPFDQPTQPRPTRAPDAPAEDKPTEAPPSGPQEVPPPKPKDSSTD